MGLVTNLPGRRPGAGPAPIALATAILALGVGAAISRAPALALAAVVALAVVAAVARRGLFAVATATLALVPWLVIFDEFVPALLRTILVGFAAALLLGLAWPLTFRNGNVIVPAGVFAAIVLAHLIFATSGAQAIQAAKYAVFPTIAVVALSDQGRILLARARNPIVVSAMLAMLVHVMIIAAGLGAIGTYYGAGERLGFAPAIPHEMALLAVVVAATGLTLAPNPPTQVALFALGAIPAAVSGVRTALVAIAVVLALYLLRNRLGIRALVVLAGVMIAASATGALDAIALRAAARPEEFASFSNAGSGRGAIWVAAITHWVSAGPVAWFFGTGLRSVEEFTTAGLNITLVGHSDFIEVGVQLGIIGLLAWLAVWWRLFFGGLQPLMMVPIVVYAVLNGSIEYVGPLSIGIVLAAACAERPTWESPAPPLAALSPSTRRRRRVAASRGLAVSASVAGRRSR